MKTNDQIANWAMDLQSLAQAGLRYGHDVFDRERYEEIRRIAGEMMAARTGIPEEKCFSGMRDIKPQKLRLEPQFLKIIKSY